jgi:hypothetical protein
MQNNLPSNPGINPTKCYAGSILKLQLLRLTQNKIKILKSPAFLQFGFMKKWYETRKIEDLEVRELL